MHARYSAVLTLVAVLPLTLVASACGGKASAEFNTPTSDPNAPVPYNAPPPTGARADRGADGRACLRPRAPGRRRRFAPMAAAVIQPILVSMGQNEAQGAQPDGSPFAGQFAAGQTLEQNDQHQGQRLLHGRRCQHRNPAARHHARRPAHARSCSRSSSRRARAQEPNATLGGKATGCWRNPTPARRHGQGDPPRDARPGPRGRAGLLEVEGSDVTASRRAAASA